MSIVSDVNGAAEAVGQPVIDELHIYEAGKMIAGGVVVVKTSNSGIADLMDIYNVADALRKIYRAQCGCRFDRAH